MVLALPLIKEYMSFISENTHRKSFQLFIGILLRLRFIFFLHGKVEKSEGFL